MDVLPHKGAMSVPRAEHRGWVQWRPKNRPARCSSWAEITSRLCSATIRRAAFARSLPSTRLHSGQALAARASTRIHRSCRRLVDVLNLSRGMAYKAALAGLDLGGGKAVIIGDPLRDKTEQLLRAYGRFVQSLHGRYFTACDVGTYSEDMDVIARECEYVTGRTVANGGAGDSSVLTALGVFQGMRAAAKLPGARILSRESASESPVSARLDATSFGHLFEDGADVVVTDVSQRAVEKILTEHPHVETVDSANELIQPI